MHRARAIPVLASVLGPRHLSRTQPLSVGLVVPPAQGEELRWGRGERALGTGSLWAVMVGSVPSMYAGRAPVPLALGHRDWKQSVLPVEPASWQVSEASGL